MLLKCKSFFALALIWLPNTYCLFTSNSGYLFSWPFLGEDIWQTLEDWQASCQLHCNLVHHAGKFLQCWWKFNLFITQIKVKTIQICQTPLDNFQLSQPTLSPSSTTLTLSRGFGALFPSPFMALDSSCSDHFTFNLNASSTMRSIFSV